MNDMNDMNNLDKFLNIKFSFLYNFISVGKNTESREIGTFREAFYFLKEKKCGYFRDINKKYIPAIIVKLMLDIFNAFITKCIDGKIEFSKEFNHFEEFKLPKEFEPFFKDIVDNKKNFEYEFNLYKDDDIELIFIILIKIILILYKRKLIKFKKYEFNIFKKIDIDILKFMISLKLEIGPFDIIYLFIRDLNKLDNINNKLYPKLKPLINYSPLYINLKEKGFI